MGPRLRWALILVALTAAYFVAGRLGLSLAFVHSSASAVWPATDVALAAALLFGARVWPAVAAGAFLGLSIVERIVELHNGTVMAANRLDRRGAIFTVRLPATVSTTV